MDLIEEAVNQYYETFNATDKSIASYILKHREAVEKMTIRELADACHSSKSTISRFIKKIGFAGFSEMKYAIKWQEQKETSEKSYKKSLITDIQMNIEQLQHWDFEEICEAIESSERLFVYGTGTEQKLCANELKRYFWVLNKYVHVIDDEMDFYVLMDDLTENDLIIIISLSGNTPSMLPFAQRIAAKRIPLMSITDLKNNKLAQLTDLRMYAFAHPQKSHLALEITTFSTFFVMVEALFRSYLDYLEQKK